MRERYRKAAGQGRGSGPVCRGAWLGLPRGQTTTTTLQRFPPGTDNGNRSPWRACCRWHIRPAMRGRPVQAAFPCLYFETELRDAQTRCLRAFVTRPESYPICDTGQRGQGAIPTISKGRCRPLASGLSSIRWTNNRCSPSSRDGWLRGSEEWASGSIVLFCSRMNLP
jgi:hypothetical protein